MALTPELIKANAELATLTDAQISVLTTLSTNDEATIIGKRIGEIHGQYDADIKEVTGIEKPNGIKTYEFLKTVVLPKVKEAQTYNQQIETLKTEKLDLEKQIKAGSNDEGLKKKLQDTENLLSQTKQQYETDVNKYKGEVETVRGELSKAKVYNEFDKALYGFKFKDDSVIPASIKELAIEKAKSDVANLGTFDWVEVEGKKVVVIRDQAGNIICNPKNKMNPYTISELLNEKLVDVIDESQQKTGAGTKAKSGGAAGAEYIDLTGVKTQVEADELIIKHLLAKGLTRGSKEMSDEQTKIRKENGVDKLPVR